MKRVSASLSFYRTVTLISFGLLLLALLVGTVRFATGDTNDSNRVLVPLLLMLPFGLAYYGLSKLKIVDFDTDNLYIKSGDVLKSIPLKNVSGIKMTMININETSFWKIKFTDDAGNQDSVRILPNENFEELKALVKELNKNVNVRTWSSSFDFDQ